jgi:predicted permease
MVLLIACANVAGMLLGRASARRQEIAIRRALGAGRGRVIRQLLTESMLLASIGGLAGGLLAHWLSGGITAASSWLPIAQDLDLRMDLRILVYATAVTALTAVLFGLAPAQRAAGFDVVASLKDDNGGSIGRQRMRRILVGAQVAMSTALLLWSGLFGRSLGRMQHVDPGFDPSGVLLATMTFERGSSPQVNSIVTSIPQRVRDSGAVESAGLSTIVPLAMSDREEFDVTFADSTGAMVRRPVLANRLSPGWFATMRIPLVAGRDFTGTDRDGAPRVAIVNETLARQFWNGDALGRRIVHNRQSLDVVGVVRDSKYWTLGETAAPALYLPVLQGSPRTVTVFARTTDRGSTTAVIQREVQRVAPELAVEIRPMDEAVAVALRPAQIGAAATGTFGVVAILLSGLGVYGLVSFAVLQRRREIGVRQVLGATPKDIAVLIVGTMARLTAAGITMGLAAGALGAMALRGFLVGVTPLDPVTVALDVAVVTIAALLACGPAALRASRTDPVRLY